MLRTSRNTLVALSLFGLSWGAAGCAGPDESLSDRRDRQRQQWLTDLPEAEADAVTPADSAVASTEAALPGDSRATRGTDALDDLDALLAEEAPAAARMPAASPVAREPRVAPEVEDPARRVPRTEDESVLDQMREDGSLQKDVARYKASMGDRHYQKSEFADAVRYYREALDLDPLMDDVRRNYNSALFFLNVRSGEIPEFTEAFVDEEKVREQQNTVSIRRNLDAAKTALDERRVEDAEGFATKAVDAVNLSPETDPSLRTESRDLLEMIRLERRRLDAERQADMIERARGQAEADLTEEQRIRDRQVQELLRKARDSMRLAEYEKVIEICDRVTELEPGNLVAQFWLRDARDQMIKQRRYKLVADRLENQKLAEEDFLRSTIPYNEMFVFPGDEKWESVQARSKSLTMISTEDPEWIRRIKGALETTRVNFIFDDTPLSDAVQQLRTLTGVGMLVDPQVDATQVLNMNLQGLSASQALNLMLEYVGMTYTYKENVLFITTPGQEKGRTEFAIYNVSDLLNTIKNFEGPELMLKPQGDQGGAPISFIGGLDDDEDEIDPDMLKQIVIESAGGEEAWSDPNSIEYHNGQFLVEAPREHHAQVQAVLANLRKDADLFVVIEARFIDIHDGFLEDIGVDSRSLGAVNNLGTAFGNVINSNRTGGQDLGFTQTGNPLTDVALVMGQDRWAGRIQHIIDGFTGTVRGERLSGGGGLGGLTLQSTWLEPFQLNVIIRAVQEKAYARELTAPVVTAHNGQRVYVSVITQRAYIADYNLVSGGTGFAIIEVADPEVATFQEGVILDVNPVISHDKKYVTLDVKPTLATLIGGVISTILISLGSFTNVAFQVPIGVPEISLQQSFTSVTVPNGGTVLLGGFKSLNEAKYTSYLPILGKIPLFGNLFRRKATLSEKRSLVILITARIVDLRGEEAQKFNVE